MQIVCGDGEEEERGDVVVIEYNVEKEGLEVSVGGICLGLPPTVLGYPMSPI